MPKQNRMSTIAFLSTTRHFKEWKLKTEEDNPFVSTYIPKSLPTHASLAYTKHTMGH